MIALSLDRGIAHVTLDRAEARNALPTAAWHGLAETIATIPPFTRVVVVESAVPGMFCAGADLADLARLADDVPARATFREAMRTGIDAIAALPMPVIAAVDGGCFGAGIALALAADLIVAAPAARFAIPPARLGIGYPAEDIARLIARIGRAQAARLLFAAATIDAEEAHRIGLVDVLAPSGDIATLVAANDPAALRLLKRMLDDPADSAHAAAFEESFGSPAFRVGTARYRAQDR